MKKILLNLFLLVLTIIPCICIGVVISLIVGCFFIDTLAESEKFLLFGLICGVISGVILFIEETKEELRRENE